MMDWEDGNGTEKGPSGWATSGIFLIQGRSGLKDDSFQYQQSIKTVSPNTTEKGNPQQNNETWACFPNRSNKKTNPNLGCQRQNALLLEQTRNF